MVTKTETKQPDPDIGTARQIHTLAHLLYGQLAGAGPGLPINPIHRAPTGCAQPKEVKMFWNDPSMYGATLYKDPVKELYPREFGIPTPFAFPTAQANPLLHPWMGYANFNTPFVGQQAYGYPQQNFGTPPTYLPWVNPTLQNLHVNPYVRPLGYETQFNAFRPTIW